MASGYKYVFKFYMRIYLCVELYQHDDGVKLEAMAGFHKNRGFLTS